MTVLERIYDELDKQGKKAARLCEATGISSGLLSTWKKRGTNPSAKYITAIADFLGVSERYLLTGESDDWTPSITARDEKDIAKRLEKTLEDLESDHDGLMFSGEPLDDETKELLRISLENSIRLAKVTAKEKFTPNKYKK